MILKALNPGWEKNTEIHEVRVYELPNIIGQAKVIHAPPPEEYASNMYFDVNDLI